MKSGKKNKFFQILLLTVLFICEPISAQSGGIGAAAILTGNGAASEGSKEFMGDIASAQQIVNSSETAAAEALKQEIAAKENLDNLKSKLAKANGDTTALKEQIKAAEKVLAEKEAARIEAAEKLVEAYKNLGDKYEAAGIVGDPVQIATGEYMYSKTDFEAEDFLTFFSVSRSLNNEGFSESFGKNWTCSLDSRIIRGRNGGIDKLKSKINNQRTILNNYISELKKFNETWNKDKENTDFSDDFEIEMEEELEKSYAELELLESENNKIDELNKYNLYGYYSNNNVDIGSDSIIFISESGQKIICQQNNGKWVPINKQLAASFFITANYSENQEDFGFIINYKNGDKKYFNKNGILEKIQDRCGNITIFENTDGKISKIINKTGEIIFVHRDSKNQIIKIEGSSSGSSQFIYSNDLLFFVSNNKGKTESYKYTNDGLLSCITTGPDARISIEYEYYKSLKKNMVSCVTDQEGNKEFFSYNLSKKKVTHITNTGNTEIYELDDDGATIWYENEVGSTKKFIFNENKQISGIQENGEWKYFIYDDFFKPVEIIFEDTTTSKTEYNDFGFITFQSDRDGFTNEFVYDEKGNLIETKFCGNPISFISYYENGLVKTVSENEIEYFYEYNNFGSPIKITETDNNGNLYSETWAYDSKNRMVSYINSSNQKLEVFYDDDSYCEITGDKKTVYYKNINQDIFKVEETDLLTGKSLCKEIIYDKLSRPVKVLLNNKQYLTYDYDKPQLMTECTIWDLNDTSKGLRMNYAFDFKNRLIKESRNFIENNLQNEEKVLYKVSYEDFDDGFSMLVQKGEMDGNKYFYNNKNRLVKIEYPNGKIERRSYTKTGKIDSIVTGNSRVDFLYGNNGNTSVITTNNNHTQSSMIYNQKGQLLEKKDFDDSNWFAKYDGKGRLILEEGDSYYTEYNYDNLNRIKSETMYSDDNSICFKIEYEYDDINRVIKKTEGNKYFEISKYDCWGNKIEVQNQNGITKFEYDELGNCISEINGANVEKKYTYDLNGNLTKEFVNQNLVEENFWSLDSSPLQHKEFGFIKAQWDYDESGNCISSVDAYGNKTSYSYDKKGFINNINKYESGNSSISFDTQNKLSIENSLGANYSELRDANNNLIEEINSFGKKANYKYDLANRISEKNDFEGNTYNFEYNSKTNSIIQTFNNKEKYSITRNPLGFITKLAGPEGKIFYSYDEGGKLVKVNDEISRIVVFYEYDNFGRCTKKYGNNFCIEYYYDETGNLVEVRGNDEDSSICIDYDVYNREIKRSLSNGVEIYSQYNDIGQKTSSYAKEPYGLILSGNFTLYDTFGRKLLESTKDGNITKYFYDNYGRLISTEYKYSEEIIENAKKEAVECGIYIGNETPKGCILNITYDEYNKLSKLLAQAEIVSMPDKNQYSWKETYSYTDSGSVASVSNYFGTIVYEYDSENRLVSKHGNNTSTGGIFFKWSDNGNLKEIRSSLKKVNFEYGLFNRPNLIKTEDYETGETFESSYSYDALGRRISENVTGKENHRFFYDGLSSDILIDSPVYTNNSSIISYTNDKISKNYEDNYRTISDSSFSQFNDFRTNKSEFQRNININKELISFESRPCISILANGIPSVYMYFDNTSFSGKETEFVVMNSDLSSVQAIVDKNGNCISISNYTTWGEPVVKSETSIKNISLSNSRNTLRNPICVFDLGNRDYIPLIKSFISKDPAKDGFNWYAYCSCDPVNFKDFSGLEKQSLSPLELARYNEGVSKHLLFDETEYKTTGISAGIAKEYDCADVSAAVDSNASTYAGISGYSEMADEFRKEHNAGKYSSARPKVNSWSFFQGDTTNNVRQTSTGFNRDAYRYEGLEKNERSETYKSLQDPNILSPGTVLVWKNSGHDPNRNWVGHTMTVLCRDFDSDGNIIGFAYIEGHIQGGRTSLGYMGTNSTWKAGVDTIDLWIGNFLGTYEIEGRNTPKCN